MTTVGAVHLESDELRPGTMLGPYELLMPIGVGGMAHVWAARVVQTRQLVALKMLLPQLAENQSFQEMFFDEARIASRIRHPNVCATYELAEHNGVLMLVMEWVDGVSVNRIFRPGPEGEDVQPRVAIPCRQAARIIGDACAGLHAAHELIGDDGRLLAVVHRDVSPHNLLLTADGVVKVTDFGVAKALGKSHMTMAGQVKGKLAYMSPEQLMGGGVDRRSDVFGLGCVLYEITTGTKPFRGEHDPQVMAAIVMGNYDPPSKVKPGYPPELEEIVTCALASSPDDRFPTADHMLHALEAYLRDSGPPMTSREVAGLLHDRCGDEILERMNALHEDEDTLFEPPRQLAESGTGSMEIDHPQRPPPQPSGSKGLVFLIVAALVGAGLGIGVLSYVRASKKTKSTTATATISAPSVTESAPPIVAPSVDAAIVENAGELDEPKPAVAPPNLVKLIVPPTATNVSITVDGVPLPPGTDSVARPDAGSLTVLVRADRHEDIIVLIEPTTPDELEVKLQRKIRKPRPNPSASASGAPVEEGPETPPNPYE